MLFRSNGVATKVGSYGTLAVTTATGAYTFTPNAAAINALAGGVSASDVFTVTVTDGVVQSPTTATLTVSVAGANDAPTLTSVSTLAGGSEDAGLTISYAALAAAADEADVDGDSLSFRIEAVSTGTLTKNGQAVAAGTTLLSSGENLVWTPVANANGTLNAFTVKAWDGALASATAVQVKVAVTAVNDLPVLAPITKSGSEDTPVSFALSDFTSAYKDVDGDAQASIRIDTLPATGTLKLNGVAVTAGQVIPLAALQGAPTGGIVGYWSFDSSSSLERNAVTGDALTNLGGATFLAQGKTGGALALNAGDADFAFHQLDKLFGNCKTKTCSSETACEGAVGLHEFAEEPLASLLVHADAGVGDLDTNAFFADLVLGGQSGHLHGDAAFFGEFDAVAQEIEHDLLHAHRIAQEHAPGIGIDING